MKNKVKVVLGGGLGNQFFQYFAGLYVSHNNHANLIVETTFSQAGRSGHRDWLNVLNLPGTIAGETSQLSLGFMVAYVRRVVRGCLYRVASYAGGQRVLPRQFRSSVVGYEPALSALRAPVTMMGYFQTWRYFDSLKESGIAPELKMETYTRWYREMEQIISNQPSIIGIHIRRGDYLVNPRIGVLSRGYYEEAVRTLKSRGTTWGEVWIFSDDIETAKKEMEELLPELGTTRFVEPPPESHSFESILLMSKVSSLIIANSTFSWWGAALGDSSRPVVCPEKWFALMEDPTDLCPTGWTRVASSWVRPF